MRIIGDTNIPFLSYRRIALSISLLVIAAGLAYQFLGPGLNRGIDFVGGTQVTLKFRGEPDLDQLRATMADLETGTPTLQRFDEPEKHEILIRVQNPEGEEGDFTGPIIELLHRDLNADLAGAFDLNTRGAQELRDLLAEVDPDGTGLDREGGAEYYEPMAEAVLEVRKERGIFQDLAELDQVEGVSDAVLTTIKEQSALGAFALLGAESVGPAVGEDLKKKAQLAVVFSLIGMLVYIWLRFQLPFGIGAVAALFHDVLISLTALAVTGREINLPTVAALLALVGYSVNDSVVVFDRVRENLKLHRGEDLEGLMNTSINQTLSRTFITSGTTLMVVLSLYFFGGDVINTFAFVLLVGVIVGTYSSIFVASPVALAMHRVLAARREKKRKKGRR
ncbi:MAG: protein translocase subunit SecF [Thermoanaerobaculales bacterium]|jgi:preprotein translocase subunit SecF|nr:protein translocase subunit SecF [Thermoanaerobaculales bacterium]